MGKIKALEKRTSNINLEKIVQQNQLFLIQFKRSNRKKISDAMRNHKSADGAFSHHIFCKKCQRKRKAIFRNPLLTSVLNQKINKQNINNYSMGAANII